MMKLPGCAGNSWDIGIGNPQIDVFHQIPMEITHFLGEYDSLYILVGGLELFFPYNWTNIIPTDELIFF